MKSLLRSSKPPGAEPTPTFVRELAHQLAGLPTHQSTTSQTMSTSRILAITGAGAFVAAAAVAVFVGTSRTNQVAVVTQAGQNFGALRSSSDNAAKQATNESLSARSTTTSEYAPGDVSTMPVSYELVTYTFPEYELPTGDVVAYRRLSTAPQIGSALTGQFFTGQAGQVRTLTFEKDGFTVDVSYDSASIYAYQSASSAEVAISSRPMELSTQPAASDETSLRAAANVVSSFGISLDGFAAPVVLPKEEGVYAWNRRTVVYPETIENLSVVDSNGDADGIRVTVAPDGTVESFGSFLHRFERSSYTPVRSKELVTQQVNGMSGLPEPETGATRSTRTLGAPTQVLSSVYTSDGKTVLVASLRFPVLDAKPGERRAIVVPLAADLYQQAQGAIEPAALEASGALR